MHSREHLAKVLAGQWLLEVRYGAELYAVLSSIGVPAFEALQIKPRGAKRPADAVMEPGQVNFEITTQEQVHMARESPSLLGGNPGKRQRVAKQTVGSGSGAKQHEASAYHSDIAQMLPYTPPNMLPQCDPPQSTHQWYPYSNPTMYNHPLATPVPVPQRIFTFTNTFASPQNFPPPPP